MKKTIYVAAAFMAVAALVFTACPAAELPYVQGDYYIVAFLVAFPGGQNPADVRVPHELASWGVGMENFPSAPVRPGHGFLGWHDDNDNEFSPHTPVTGNTILVANWVDQLQVVFDLNFEGAEGIDPLMVNRGGVMGLSFPAPTREGYFFYGWFDVGDAHFEDEFANNTTIVAPVTLRARWRLIQRIIVNLDADNDHINSGPTGGTPANSTRSTGTFGPRPERVNEGEYVRVFFTANNQSVFFPFPEEDLERLREAIDARRQIAFLIDGEVYDPYPYGPRPNGWRIFLANPFTGSSWNGTNIIEGVWDVAATSDLRNFATVASRAHYGHFMIQSRNAFPIQVLLRSVEIHF